MTFLYVAVAEAMGEEYEIRIITEDEALKEKPLEPETPKKKIIRPMKLIIRTSTQMRKHQAEQNA